MQLFLWAFIACLNYATATLQGINGYHQTVHSGIDISQTDSEGSQGFSRTEFSIRCVRKGIKYEDDGRMCVCVWYFRANCTEITSTTTEPSGGGSSTTEPSGGGSTTGSSTSTSPTDPTTTPTPANPHPLDPLTQDEIRRTAHIINSNGVRRRQAEGPYIYNYITLKEPPKSVLLPYFLSDTTPPSDVYPRKSFSVVIDRSTSTVYEIVVNLDTEQIESKVEQPDVQPSLSPEDLTKSERITREDPGVIERCRALGWTNMSLVNADPWSMGYVGDKPEYQGKRLVQLYLYGKHFEDDNQYAHPFDFIVIVDMNEDKVIGFEELPTHDDDDPSNKEGNTIPQADANYDHTLRGKGFLRTDDKPITVDSPEGASFKVNGNEIQWQKWKFRVGFNGREGLVLYTANYNDNGTVRPVFYRASLSEMFIPYGDPRYPYHRKAVFDLGEYGIGFNADEQRLGQDVIGAAKFFDGVLNNSTGDGNLYSSVVSVREEDAGILWKHVDFRTGKGVVVRSHRLVVSFIATVGNYDYIFLWEFYQDGSIHLNIQMTGILAINLLAVGSTPAGHGSIEAHQINAQYHQHFFAVRLDTEIDGNSNTVYTSDSVPVDQDTGSRENPYGQGFTTQRTYLRTASTARTKVKPENGRVWVVTNPEKTHPYTKEPTGWKLMPHNSPPMLMREDSPLRPKAAFLDYDMWVTPYVEDEIFAGGFYLNNSGLPEWVGRDPDANTENTDIVLWHMFGIVHIPRVEDYPVMPVEQTGFWFKPYNFFNENPGIDVPPPNAAQSRKVEL